MGDAQASTNPLADLTAATVEIQAHAFDLAFEVWGSFLFVVLLLGYGIWIQRGQLSAEREERKTWQDQAFASIQEDRDRSDQHQERLFQSVQAQKEVVDYLKQMKAEQDSERREVIAQGKEALNVQQTILSRLDAIHIRAN